MPPLVERGCSEVSLAATRSTGIMNRKKKIDRMMKPLVARV
jgi:hypothetical protein